MMLSGLAKALRRILTLGRAKWPALGSARRPGAAIVLRHAPSVGTPVNINPKRPFTRTGDQSPRVAADRSGIRIHLGVCGAPRH